MKKDNETNLRRIGRLLSLNGRRLNALLARRLEPLGLGPGQHSLLFALENEDNQIQRELAAVVVIDKGAAQRAIKKLERTGLVETKADKADGRAVRVKLTSEGKSVLKKVKAEADDLVASLLDGFTPDEREEFERLMQKIALNAACKAPSDRD